MLKLYSISDVAETCRVSVMTVRRWIDRGELATVNVSGLIRITEEEVYAFIGLPVPDEFDRRESREITQEEAVAYALRQAEKFKRQRMAEKRRRPCTRAIARRTRERVAGIPASSAPAPGR